jgi:large subunit ribosomal protein L9
MAQRMLEIFDPRIGLWYNRTRRALYPSPASAGYGARILLKGLEMKVLLLKDVYKLGRAGDVKKVADGYGRNFLLPRGLAVLATEGMLKQADRIRSKADVERARLTQELGSVAEQLEGLELTFPVKASETGRLYGSVTTMMISEAIQATTGLEVERRQIDSQPLKTLGVHQVDIRLTLDLVPGIVVVIHREDEPPESAYDLEEVGEVPVEPEEAFSELVAELEAAEEEEQGASPELELTEGSTAVSEDQNLAEDA